LKTVPFTKVHGAENDFLLTWGDHVEGCDLPALARKICTRTTGIGADGWMLLWRAEAGLRTKLFNSDGSEPEISGNGTRCAAAYALHLAVVPGPEVVIATQAGARSLKLIGRSGVKFSFEMAMGAPKIEELHVTITANGQQYDATLLNVGNPQCAVFVSDLSGDWHSPARELESNPRFPHRTNVSFSRVLDPHTIETVFYERGAGETRSSGTGSTGAAAAAILRGIAESPVEVRTPAGSLRVRWDDDVYLTGPAELIGEGQFFYLE
jgi:diaminopimelate epimerase